MSDRSGPPVPASRDAGARPQGPRLRDAMPRPLLAVFAAGAVLAVLIAVVLIIRPPAFDTVPLGERRPPPRGTLSHDVVEVFPPPPPVNEPDFDPPCDAVAGVRPLGSGAGVGRLRAALHLVCTIAGPGVPPIIGEAVAGLEEVTVGFADFRVTGSDSTLDLGSRTIWLNLRLAARDRPIREIAPVLLHEAWHLAHADRAITVEQEFDARRVEHEVCRQLISPQDWPRACEDAAAIVALGRGAAGELLASSGYAR